MKFKGTFVAPRVDFTKYRQALHNELLELLTRAAFEWLEETAKTIPQWSGASAATFLHLARQIGYSLPISRAATAPFNGEPMGLGASRGEFVSDPNSGQYHFIYSTTLKHLIYNEFNNANLSPDDSLFSRLLQPGPYRFQDRGQAAFLRVASGVRLPEPIYKLKRIRVK